MQILMAARRGDGLDNRTAELLLKLFDIDLGMLFLVDIALVQCNNDRYTKLQKLCCKEQASAQVGRIHDIDDCIRMFITDILTRDALLRCKRRHGVRARKINCNDFLALRELFFYGKLFPSDGNTGPVTDLFVSSCQGIVHRSLATVRIAGKCNSHTIPSLFMKTIVRSPQPLRAYCLCCSGRL